MFCYLIRRQMHTGRTSAPQEQHKSKSGARNSGPSQKFLPCCTNPCLTYLSCKKIAMNLMNKCIPLHKRTGTDAYNLLFATVHWLLCFWDKNDLPRPRICMTVKFRIIFENAFSMFSMGRAAATMHKQKKVILTVHSFA
jgi:hypothetical protein